MKRDFSLYKRKGQKVWYFAYYEGTKRLYKSTGCRYKYEAAEFAEKFLRINRRDKEITFGEYAADFFDWDKCDWLKRKRVREDFSRHTADNYRYSLLKHLIPRFGDKQLQKITPAEIEEWLIELPLASTTKRGIKSHFNIIMREAVKEGIIEINPVRSVTKFSKKRQKVRSVLTQAEIKKLFPEEEEEWKAIWIQRRWYTFFYLILTTGMRSGEARALRWQDILFDENIILIERGVKPDGTIGSTKADYSRAAFLTDRTTEMLKVLREEVFFQGDEDLIFPVNRSLRPYGASTVLGYYKRGLKAAKIDTEGRILDVQALRHTYNTIICVHGFRKSFSGFKLVIRVWT